MTNQLQWHADREQIRVALEAREGTDLAQAAAEQRRRCSVLEAENGHLRALVSAARYLSSEVVRGTMTANEAAVALEAETNAPAPGPAGSLADLLACADCRSHLASDTLVIDACASVAQDTSRPVGRVLADYLALHHRRHGNARESAAR